MFLYGYSLFQYHADILNLHPRGLMKILIKFRRFYQLGSNQMNLDSS